MSTTDRALLHGLTTRPDGIAMVFFPLTVCKACGKKFVNRTKQHNHSCRRMFGLAVQRALVLKKRLADQ